MNDDQVPEITEFRVVRERKQEQVYKEQAQEIILSIIVVKDHNESIGKKKDVR